MSPNEPRPSSLWLKDGELYFYEGGWKPVKANQVSEVASPEEKPSDDEFGTKPIPGYSLKLLQALYSDSYLTDVTPVISYETLMSQGDQGSISLNTLFPEGLNISDNTTTFIFLFGWFFMDLEFTDFLGESHTRTFKMQLNPEYDSVFNSIDTLVLSDYKFKFSIVNMDTLKWIRTEA